MSKKAIVKYDGRQFSCVEGEVITVNRLSQEVGDTVSLAPVVAYLDDNGIAVDAEKLKATTVEATVEAHERTKKIVTRKYRRRKVVALNMLIVNHSLGSR